ncbi:hypothetical protein ACFO9Q_05455 [Paenibacillus sp. GCM10023252]|uniref:hypothetical protein n=1 Tax=Paenibacillus sp. GCM10023252 TaxID=3252649 RepID=UPI003610B88B
MQLSIFCISSSQSESLEIVQSVGERLRDYVTSSEIQQLEQYYKIDGWYKINVNYKLKVVLTDCSAASILESLCSQWEWLGDKQSVYSLNREPDTVFFNSKIQFLTCYFDEFNEFK